MMNLLKTLYKFPLMMILLWQLVLMKLQGVKYEKGIKLIGLTHWYVKGKVQIGINFTSASNQKHSIDTSICSKISVSPNAFLKIGNNVGMTCVSVQCTNYIEIGNHVIIGAGALIMDSDFHDISWKMRRTVDTGCSTAKNAPIRIGNDCFIGTRSIICKGVTIGDRSVIAAGSVVVKSIPADEIWGGNPARFIKKMTNDIL